MKDVIGNSRAILVPMGLMLLLLMALKTPHAFAHEKHYVWNAEYRTLPQGTFELESWTTSKVPDFKKTNENEWEYQGEVEYGLTDHFIIANKEKWTTENTAGVDDDEVPNKNTTKFSEFAFELKYRIGEVGKYWVDPLIYVEILRDPRDHNIELGLEEKIVLSKDIGKMNVTYNQIMESQFGHGGMTEQAFTFCLNYEVFDSFRAGFETKGQYWNPGTHRNELAMGPTLSYVHQYFWVTLGTLFGVNHAADDWQTRLIVGVPIG